MTNLEFFKSCLTNELQATYNMINSLPADQMEYKPAENNRTANEITEHIVAHTYDFQIILTETKCDELLIHPFEGPEDAANYLKKYWDMGIEKLNELSNDDWNNTFVELLVHGNSFATMSRCDLMWFYFFDIIHHRGQLSSYIRPMGGKNPIVYGYSFDSQNSSES